MPIELNHTIVPARGGGGGVLRANLRADAAAAVGALRAGAGERDADAGLRDAEDFESHHYAFHVDEATFEQIFGRVQAESIPYGSGPRSATDMRTNSRKGGRGVYFRDPDGHLLELMTAV